MPDQSPSSQTGDPPTAGAPGSPGGSSDTGTQTPAEAFAAAQLKFAELLNHFLYYLAAKRDAFSLAIRKRVLRLWAIIVAVLAAAGAVVTAIVLICNGIADGLSLLFHERWLGELVAGTLVLAAMATSVHLLRRWMIAASHAGAVARYESRLDQQRQQFGHDAARRAAEADHP